MGRPCVRRSSGRHSLPISKSCVRGYLLAAAAVSLSGCYSFRGPEPVYDAQGIRTQAAYGPRSGPLYTRFYSAAYKAAGCTSAAGASPSAQPIVNCGGDASSADQTRFMRSAYAMIYADCDHYFAHMGRRQGGSRILRASIAPVISLLTGLITLKDFTNGEDEKDLLTALTLGSNAATSGLDVFDENFLFGANNIDAVRQLITRAMAKHASETLEKSDVTFEQAAINILDNQNICRPPQIMKLTREAIANGSVTPRVSTDDNRGGDDDDDDDGDAGQVNGNETGALETTSVSVPQ